MPQTPQEAIENAPFPAAEGARSGGLAGLGPQLGNVVGAEQTLVKGMHENS